MSESRGKPMSKRERRAFTTEFKQQLVDLHFNGKSQSEICREYDIVPSVLRRWIDQASNSGSFKEEDNRTPNEEELIRLRRENKQLLMECDILKQAALIMGRK